MLASILFIFTCSFLIVLLSVFLFRCVVFLCSFIFFCSWSDVYLQLLEHASHSMAWNADGVPTFFVLVFPHSIAWNNNSNGNAQIHTWNVEKKPLKLLHTSAFFEYFVKSFELWRICRTIVIELIAPWMMQNFALILWICDACIFILVID